MLAPRLLLMNFFSCPIFFGKSCLADLYSFTTRPFSSIIFSISKWMHHSSNPFSSKLFKCHTLSLRLALSSLSCLLCSSSKLLRCSNSCISCSLFTFNARTVLFIVIINKMTTRSVKMINNRIAVLFVNLSHLLHTHKVVLKLLELPKFLTILFHCVIQDTLRNLPILYDVVFHRYK